MIKVYADCNGFKENMKYVSSFSTYDELEQFFEKEARHLLEVAEQDRQRCGFYPPAVADLAGNYEKAINRIRNYYVY